MTEELRHANSELKRQDSQQLSSSLSKANVVRKETDGQGKQQDCLLLRVPVDVQDESVNLHVPVFLSPALCDAGEQDKVESARASVLERKDGGRMEEEETSKDKKETRSKDGEQEEQDRQKGDHVRDQHGWTSQALEEREERGRRQLLDVGSELMEEVGRIQKALNDLTSEIILHDEKQHRQVQQVLSCGYLL